MGKHRVTSAIIVTLFALFAGSGFGDEFVLRSGARIVGTWLNPDQPQGSRYEIRTEQGVWLALDAGQVMVARRQSDAEREYEQIRWKCGDTVDEHWRLVKWCDERGLGRQRDTHLQRIVDLDPRQERAWAMLGFVQISGKWTTRQQFLRERGYAVHDGTWRLPQESKLIDRRKQTKAGEGDWYAKLKQWRGRLTAADGVDAWNRIAAVRDPLAIRAISTLLPREPLRRVRMLYVDVLSQIPDREATAVLIATALRDADMEVFYACVDKIVARKSPELIQFFSRSLSSPNNQCVNRAAYVLSQFEDSSALAPLVDALYTVHQSVTPANDTYTVGIERVGLNGGSDPFTSQESGFDNGQMLTVPPASAQAVTQRVANAAVLDALVKLSGGVSFGYDQVAWRRWLTVRQQQAKPPAELQVRSD